MLAPPDPNHPTHPPVQNSAIIDGVLTFTVVDTVVELIKGEGRGVKC